MPTESQSEWFARQLRTALTALYDPSALRSSPLAELFGVAGRGDAVFALRQTLTGAIECLRPNERAPTDSRVWRVYQILRRRYTEQLTQRAVASHLGLSVRQLQRDEKLAREVLADHLWIVYELESKVADAATTAFQTEDEPPFLDTQMPTLAEELEQLRSSVPVEMAAVGAVIQEVVETVRPMLKPSGVTFTVTVPEDLPQMLLKPPLLRQALLSLVSRAIDYVPGGQVRVQAEAHPQQMSIEIQATAGPGAPLSQNREPAERLQMAEQLIRLSQGRLEITPDLAAQRDADEGSVFSARVTLPLAEQAIVLVMDDNADTLQLLRRYLSGSRYRFVGTQNAEEGLALAKEFGPQIIVLDVLMPEKDGWTVLGRFREHPKTRDVPIIVCTILPQEHLALTLGAAEFIRKPVDRTTLLTALERQLDRQAGADG